MKPGHRCARIVDMANDAYSAIDYIYVEKIRVELLRPLRAHAHAHSANVIDRHAQSRVLLCRHTHGHTDTQTRMQTPKETLMHKLAHALMGSCTHTVARKNIYMY